jgi:uncharacterized protein YndB with AHSA1/START domain
LFLGFVATRPSDFRVERSIEIAAPTEAVFPHVNDFHRWAAWSPWEKLDPAMKKDFGGAPAGVGATYAWQGNDDVGSGKMSITESRPNERIGIQLVFLSPFEATNKTEFAFTPAGAGSTLTWTMTGQNDFMGKLFSVFMDMDWMIGKDFEAGLSGIKAQAEAGAKG